MNRDEVKELFKMLVNVYPSFEVSKEKVDIWTKVMSHMDCDGVMVKAKKHIQENKFAPTIAEIASKKGKEDEDYSIFIR